MNEKIKVKILKHVGRYAPGDIVEVPALEAEQLCLVGTINDGVSVVTHKRAMLLEDFEAIESIPADPSQMTAGELAALGMRNVVVTPVDTVIENALSRLKDENAPFVDESRDETTQVVPQSRGRGRPPKEKTA